MLNLGCGVGIAYDEDGAREGPQVKIEETTWELLPSDLPHDIVHDGIPRKRCCYPLQEEQVPENRVPVRHRLDRANTISAGLKAIAPAG